MKKTVPVLVFLMLLLLSPSMSWAEEATEAGGSSEVKAEQADANGDNKANDDKAKKKAKKAGKKKGDEEPECD